MSKNYAIVNGVKIELPDDVDELTFTRKTVEKKKKSPFKRVNKYDKYFYIDIDGKVDVEVEKDCDIDDDCYSVANYCTDKTMMEQRALHEVINRLLWRYSEEHGGDNEWGGTEQHWHIYKSAYKNDFDIECNTSMKWQGAVYFKNEETAKSAIDEIVKPFIKEHPEFVW